MFTVEINETVLELFSRLVKAQRLAHAYLFVGSAYAGKTQTALAIAQLVNCDQSFASRPCGQCMACRKIVAGNHPDVHVFSPDESGNIKIDNIRFLLSRAQLKPFEAKFKVFILRTVEHMTTEAANALLKTLEEPSPNTLMILTTVVLESNLATIKSRCQVVKFFPTSVNRLAHVLTQQGLAEPEAHFLAFYADGCLGRAHQLIEQGTSSERNQVLDALLARGFNDDLIKALSTDLDRSSEALRVLLVFFRDALLMKSGVDESSIAYQDRLRDVRAFADRPFEDLTGIIQQIVQTKKLIDDRLNIKMSLTLLRERIWAS